MAFAHLGLEKRRSLFLLPPLDLNGLNEDSRIIILLVRARARAFRLLLKQMLTIFYLFQCFCARTYCCQTSCSTTCKISSLALACSQPTGQEQFQNARIYLGTLFILLHLRVSHTHIGQSSLDQSRNENLNFKFQTSGQNKRNQRPGKANRWCVDFALNAWL